MELNVDCILGFEIAKYRFLIFAKGVLFRISPDKMILLFWDPFLQIWSGRKIREGEKIVGWEFKSKSEHCMERNMLGYSPTDGMEKLYKIKSKTLV